MDLAFFLSLKFLREHRGQSMLTIVATSIGVAVMIFLSSLISGLQANLIEQTLGTQAHLVVRPRKEVARPQLRDEAIVRRVEPPAQRVTSIPEWQRVERRLLADPDVVATAPLATGSAFASRGNANRPVVIMATNTDAFGRIVAVSDSVVAGRARISGNEALIGVELAEDLGVQLGDRIRVTTPEGREALLTVEGLLDMGNRVVNRRWLLTPLRTGQALLALPGGANVLHAKVRDIFEAERVAQRVSASSGLEVDSWMETNAQLLVALKSQSSSSYTIQFFVFLAVAMGIASVLAVSVVQRTREIGILRAMGVSRGVVFRTFLLQGALIGLLGALFGAGFGVVLARVFEQLAVGPDGAPLFPFDLNSQLFVASTAAALATGMLAGALPARRAALLDPVEAIRHA